MKLGLARQPRLDSGAAKDLASGPAKTGIGDAPDNSVLLSR